MAKKYTVIYEHDGAMWFARVASVDGCHTQGRTIAQARTRIREALSLFDDDADKAVLVDDVRLPRALLAELKKVIDDRAAIDAKVASIRARTAKVARALTKEIGVSLHDAGELLGVSKQRVQQILESA